MPRTRWLTQLDGRVSAVAQFAEEIQRLDGDIQEIWDLTWESAGPVGLLYSQ